MAYRLAKWHEIEACRRCFMTLPTGERIYYRVHGFRDMHTASGLRAYARISREGAPPGDIGLYPANALAFETATGEIIK